jgi:hypothetical protein
MRDRTILAFLFAAALAAGFLASSVIEAVQ